MSCKEACALEMSLEPSTMQGHIQKRMFHKKNDYSVRTGCLKKNAEHFLKQDAGHSFDQSECLRGMLSIPTAQDVLKKEWLSPCQGGTSDIN